MSPVREVPTNHPASRAGTVRKKTDVTTTVGVGIGFALDGARHFRMPVSRPPRSHLHEIEQHMDALTPGELEFFQENGFLVLQQLAPVALVERLGLLTEELASIADPPVEYEASVGYPGAPESQASPGGRTVRRLRHAVSRHPLFLEWACSPAIAQRLRPLLGDQLVLPLAHHNCIMLKDPTFSSDTDWHQDCRYWNYERTDLVSVQLALNDLTATTGSLHFLPGSHRIDFGPDRLDEEKFLRLDHPANQELLASVVETELAAGDVVLFHARTFHAASRNRSDQPRRSVIFTYHCADNRPMPGSRSAASPEIIIPCD
ncbi:Phytanoyl-CoA dioxygenase (PhyH) [Planctomycetes bacterium Pan216]|uniref:Phytanoyl-CoA dioxygenase (PhyH) n=1 Tax=Kolteria novifilia TaxID=2527975 RepID=A0A518B4C1_9BACT|nr:Phytanoyl-CoA dioxygenase (PhyH) [Planctomycetes bacterium Pan216]